MRTANFDSLKVGELTVSFLDAPLRMSAKAAFINTQTGQTHGWTTCTQWSPETIDKLKELRFLLERDLEALHFVEGSTKVGPSTTTTSGGSLSQGFKGLGENLKSVEDDVPPG